MTEIQKTAAILVADVVGKSRLAGTDENRTLARLRALRSDLIDPTTSVHHGHVVKRTGGGSIIEFRSVVDAVRCAIEVQTAMVERNVGVPTERRIEFRVGVHLEEGLVRVFSAKARICRGDMPTLGLTPSEGSAEAAPGRPSRIKDTPQSFDSHLAKIRSRPTSSQ